MTKYESIITEVATDIRWLKKSIEENARSDNEAHNKIIEHLRILNGSTQSNSTWVTALRWAVGALAIALLSLASYVIMGG